MPSEETVNKFFVGAEIVGIFMYDDAIHILCDNDGMLAITEIDGELDVDILGPDYKRKHLEQE